MTVVYTAGGPYDWADRLVVAEATFRFPASNLPSLP